MTEAEANKRNRRQARNDTRDQDVIGFGCFLTNHLQRTKGETKGNSALCVAEFTNNPKNNYLSLSVFVSAFSSEDF